MTPFYSAVGNLNDLLKERSGEEALPPDGWMINALNALVDAVRQQERSPMIIRPETVEELQKLLQRMPHDEDLRGAVEAVPQRLMYLMPPINPVVASAVPEKEVEAARLRFRKDLRLKPTRNQRPSNALHQVRGSVAVILRGPFLVFKPL